MRTYSLIYLNTSYVSVKYFLNSCLTKKAKDLNTSYVSVKLK